jgi:SAM-dependent methyltransferase
MTQSVRFFETQFQRQVAAAEFALNPFERLALPFLNGEVLDLGCGLGNLALEAARAGCRVAALDGSPTGIARIREAALNEGLAVVAREADLAGYRLDRDYDAIVCIGLLMFLPRERAEMMDFRISPHKKASRARVKDCGSRMHTCGCASRSEYPAVSCTAECRRRTAGKKVLRESRSNSTSSPPFLHL